MSKDHPILFSGPMINAILSGAKTQTRRVIKPQFSKLWGYGVRNQDAEYFSAHVDIKEPNGEWRWLRCPYGKPGDRLWVRETWTGGMGSLGQPSPGNVSYRADGEILPQFKDTTYWRPSIHMPRWASRITLEVTGVKVERVQDISQEDAKAEGVGAWHNTVEGTVWTPEFHFLWDSINAKRGFGWATNPWCWAITFKVVTP